jgi:hypothetical protein
MRALLLLLVAACEREPTPEPKPPPRDAAVPESCELADDRIALGKSLELRFHGKAFASVGGRVQHVEVHLGEHSTATTTSELATLWGDVEPKTIELRPRKDTLVDGWLAIHAATLANTRDPAELVIHPSSLVVLDHPPSVHFRCKELTLAETPETLVAGEDSPLRPGKTSPIAHEPKRPAFAKLVTHSEPSSGIPELPDAVRVQAERDGWVQVVIESSDADVHGWVPSDALAPDKAQGLLGGLLGGGLEPHEPKLQSCPNAMPIFVRDGGTTDRVGTTIPGAKLPVVATTADALVLDLGAEPDSRFTLAKPQPYLQPFVHRADAAGCKRVRP